MVKPRVRPTRDQTRLKIFEAATRVFANNGVRAATVEQIASEAGFTRGAFYSNFDSKDDLVIAMLDDHVETAVAANTEMAERHPTADGFVSSMKVGEGRPDDPLHHAPLTQMELYLHAALSPSLRPALEHQLVTMRNLVGNIAKDGLVAMKADGGASAEELGQLLVALEDGLRLHRLIAPHLTEPDAFPKAVALLTAMTTKTSTGDHQ